METNQPRISHGLYGFSLTVALPFAAPVIDLLRGLEIARPNQVWSADITCISLQHGFMYSVTIIDWFSRYVPA